MLAENHTIQIYENINKEEINYEQAHANFSHKMCTDVSFIGRVIMVFLLIYTIYDDI